MYTIEFDSDLIKGVELIDINLLNPHEENIERISIMLKNLYVLRNTEN